MPHDSFQQNQLYDLIVESATGFAIFTIDETGKVTSWNVGSERLLGYSSEEMIGNDSDVIFTPEDRARGAPQHERDEARNSGCAVDERWHMRRDGTRFWGSGQLMPLRGNVGQYLKIFQDRTTQHIAEEQLKESQEQFRLLATSIPQLVFRTRPDGNRTWGSPQWADFTGLSDTVSQNLGWVDAVHPDDRRATMQAWSDAERSREYYCEHRVRRKTDGSYRWHQTRARPIRGDDATPSDWVGTSTDIHDLRVLRDTQELLMAELQHRTRNLLAVVQAIAGQTRRSSDTIEDFSEQFAHRLRALSRVQGLLSRSDHQTARLYAVIQAELAAYVTDEDMQTRITIDGKDVPLDANATQTLALVLHELTTNAIKYGALSTPTGKLGVNWTIEDGQGSSREPVLSLQWVETGLSLNGPPQRRGYGMELIERALPYQLGAKTKIFFEPHGLRCDILLPLARMQKAR